MSDRGAYHRNIGIDPFNENLLAEVDRLKGLIKKLLSEISILNAARPGSVPRRYSQYLEEMAVKFDGVDRLEDINIYQVKQWVDEVLRNGKAVVRYLVLDVKVRPEPPGLTVVDGGKQ